MAAPPSKTLKDLSGKWVLNKSISDSIEPALALQGIGWVTRKALGLATVTLSIKQYTGPPLPPSESKEQMTHIEVAQTATGGLKGTTESRCIDGVFREHADWLFGSVKGRSSWAAAARIGDDAEVAEAIGASDMDFLRKGWIEGEEQQHILNHVVSLDSGGWTATQMWGFELFNGQRYYARHIVVAKGEQSVAIKLVYDYIGPA